MRYWIWFIVIACTSPKSEQGSISNDKSIDDEKDQLSIQFAKTFDISYQSGYKVVTLKSPWQGNENELVYVLRQKGTPVDPTIEELGQVIDIPVRRIICNSTSQIALLEVLGLEENLVGFPQTQFIYSETINSLVDSGAIQEVGIEARFNIEKVISLNPDIVMAFNAGSENKQLVKLKELGVQVIINSDYMEPSLLGRAEWLKFVSVFFNKERKATVEFDKIVSAYDSLKNMVDNQPKSTVFSGHLYGGSWFMPGGQNYGSQLINDAGGRYLWSENESNGWLNISFEVVYDKAKDADIWIGVGGFEYFDQLTGADPRYAEFSAFKNGTTFSYTKKISEGANDYFESGTFRADLILADYIKMIHPEILPDYELTYYKKLE